MLVYAYSRGGATEAGLVALAQLLPAALFAPFAGRRSLLFGYVWLAVALGATAAVLLAHGPALVAYACAAVAATAVTVTRPAQAAIVPGLARTPDELTAANVIANWVESASVLAAPALAGVLLAVASAGWVFAVMAALAAAAAALIVRPLRAPRSKPLREGSGGRELLREPGVRLLIGLLGAEAVLIGALDVLYVVLAVSELGLGGPGPGT